MNNLVNDIITWESLQGYDRSQFNVSIDSAVLKQKESCFEMSLTLNSIVPIDDEKRLKAHIINGVPGLKNVNIKYRYKDLILSKEEFRYAQQTDSLIGMTLIFSIITRL